MAKEKPVPVSFSKQQKEVIKGFKGKLGDTEPEIIRNIVVMWLFQNNYFNGVKDDET